LRAPGGRGALPALFLVTSTNLTRTALDMSVRLHACALTFCAVRRVLRKIVFDLGLAERDFFSQ